MDIVASHYFSTQDLESDDCRAHSKQGWTHQMLYCVACSKVTLTKSFSHEDMEPEDDHEFETLYPSSQEVGVDPSLPLPVLIAHNEALQARKISANAYAILLGRMLEVICENRNVQGKNLFEKLKTLAEKGELPSNLVGVAKGLRILRNIGVHELPLLR